MHIRTRLLCTLALALVFTQAANAAPLADRHAAKKLPCTVCHDGTPKAGDMVSDAKCLGCHGPRSKIEALYADKKELNPHKNHLGEIECTICHKGHSQSQAYCEQCHQDFKMPMK